MAKQKSALTIQGTIGNLTFYKSQDGFMVKAKSEVSKDKIFSDSKFARTRENIAEFAAAGSTGKILRTPFSNLLQQSADNRMVSRLAAKCLKVVQTDSTNKRGERTITNGDLSLLENFEFNIKGLLSSTLLSVHTISFTRETGEVSFNMPAFIPAQGIAAPSGTTHFKLQLAAAPVDFTISKNISQQIASSIMPWNSDSATVDLTLNLPAASTLPVFILLQLQFLTQTNSDYYPLQNGAFNACAIIKTDIQ